MAEPAYDIGISTDWPRESKVGYSGSRLQGEDARTPELVRPSHSQGRHAPVEHPLHKGPQLASTTITDSYTQVSSDTAQPVAEPLVKRVEVPIGGTNLRHAQQTPPWNKWGLG